MIHLNNLMESKASFSMCGLIFLEFPLQMIPVFCGIAVERL